MAIKYENELYQPIKDWLHLFLQENVKTQFVKTFIGADETMHKILLRETFSSRIKNLSFFEFKIDVFAVIEIKNEMQLVIVECKKEPIGLIHLGQLIGYSQIIVPWKSILISPKGASSLLRRFITVHRASHLLKYGEDGQISICQWDIERKKPLTTDVIPRGSLDPVSFF